VKILKVLSILGLFVVLVLSACSAPPAVPQDELGANTNAGEFPGAPNPPDGAPDFGTGNDNDANANDSGGNDNTGDFPGAPNPTDGAPDFETDNNNNANVNDNDNPANDNSANANDTTGAFPGALNPTDGAPTFGTGNDNEAPAAETPVGAQTTATPAVPAGVGLSGSEGDGVETYESFAAAVRDAGESAEQFGEPYQLNQPGVAPNTVYTLALRNDVQLQVVEFQDADARQAFNDTVVEGTQALNQLMPGIARSTHVWGRGRIAVVYYGDQRWVIDYVNRIMGYDLTGDTAPSEPGSAGGIGILTAQQIASVQQFAAQQLGLQNADLRVIVVEQQTWEDSCLGLGQANESCLRGEFPGYRVIIANNANGQQYEVRASSDLSTIRMNNQ